MAPGGSGRGTRPAVLAALRADRGPVSAPPRRERGPSGSLGDGRTARPASQRQAVEYLTQHVVLHTTDTDDQAAALAIDPLDGIAAFA
jgi:hypothetical protein